MRPGQAQVETGSKDSRFGTYPDTFQNQVFLENSKRLKGTLKNQPAMRRAAHMNLAWAYEQKGLFDKAITEMQKAVAEENQVSPQLVLQLARSFALAGKKAEAMQVMAKLNQSSKRNYISPYDTATVALALGEKDRAIAELQRVYGSR